MSKIAIICSNYNSDKWIDGYLKNVDALNLPEFSIVFVDASSTDRSLDKIEAFKFRDGIDKKVIRSNTRITLYEAWNVAIKECDAEYVVNLNTDDRFYSNALDVYAKNIDDHPEVDVFYGPCHVVDNENHTNIIETYNWPEYTHENLHYQCICGPFPLVKKKAIEDAGFFDEKLFHSGDYEMWIRLSLLGKKFRKIQEAVGSYFFNPVGLSTNPETRNRALGEDALIRRKYKNPHSKKLSILICTLEERKHFLDRLIGILTPQINKFGNDVEILIAKDNREHTIGTKRNELLFASNGEYICFVDDDDVVSENYIELILSAIESGPDVVGMHLLHFENGVHTGLTFHSIKYDSWWQENGVDGYIRYYRNPNHLNPVKRQHALRAMFPECNMGEDRKYSEILKPMLKTEKYIEQPIYSYLFVANK